MLKRATSLLLCCVYLFVVLFSGLLHEHSDEATLGLEKDCAACALHFHGAAEEPAPTRIPVTFSERDVQFSFAAPVGGICRIALPPERGPPFCA
ncbi:MAG TPA: hypothetical protein VEH27_20275 [Methylomirabilota bacterium]|nr:hypothetical protein [Methylomirabilota bacterium]